MTFFPNQTIYFHTIITALSYALDITEGQPQGHSVRCCWIGMHLGQMLNLNAAELQDLYYTLLLKDAGCSSTASRLCQLYATDELQVKRHYKEINSQDKWVMFKFVVKYCAFNHKKHHKIKQLLRFLVESKGVAQELTQIRCHQGAKIALELGLGHEVASGISCLDEHYNGKGLPNGLAGQDIPLYSQIALLSQVVDVFYKAADKTTCIKQINKRSGTWFDPKLVQLFNELKTNQDFWDGLDSDQLDNKISQFYSAIQPITLDASTLNKIAEVFGDIVDAKSSYTAGHSRRVAYYAQQIAAETQLNHDSKNFIYAAGLLHDIGKLGVSNTILDKPGPLDENEWVIMKKHPFYTHEILSRFLNNHPFVSIAADHHERLDGTGYFRGKKSEQIALETRIITIADIYDALTAARPYRDAMTPTAALKIMDSMCHVAIDFEYMSILHELLKNNNALF